MVDGKSAPKNIVFHRAQARVYFELLDGKNVILSAPTSFGKSLVIDTIIATELDTKGDLDHLLNQIRELPVDSLDIKTFERELLTDAKNQI